MKRLILKAEADIIVSNNNAFIKKEENINGCNVVQYNYFVANEKDFIEPLKSDPKLDGFELRGLTFIQNPDSGEWVRFLQLHKFFNLNQVALTQENLFKNLVVTSIREKADGSLINFVKFPNGKIVAKSKFGFESEQAIEANNIYLNTIELQNFVKHCFDNNLQPLFEYISPYNRIVVRYNSESLRLIQVRNSQTGKYLDNNELQKLATEFFNGNQFLSIVEDYTNQFYDLLSKINLLKLSKSDILNHLNISSNDYIKSINEACKQIQELTETKVIEKDPDSVMTMLDLIKIFNLVLSGDSLEGFIVRFSDDTFVKMKNENYFVLHKLITEDVSKENEICKFILDNTIDDVLSSLPQEDQEIRAKINSISEILIKEINSIIKNCNNLLDDFKSGLSRKEFFELLKRKNLTVPYGGLISKELNSIEVSGKVDQERLYSNVISYIRSKTLHLNQARDYLQQLGYVNTIVSKFNN